MRQKTRTQLGIKGMHVLEAYWVALWSSAGPRSWKPISDLAANFPHTGHQHSPQGNRSSVANTPNPEAHSAALQILQHCCPRMDHIAATPIPPSPPCLRCSLLLHVTPFWFTPVSKQVRLTSRCPGVYPCPHYGESETYLIFIYKVGGGLIL